MAGARFVQKVVSRPNKGNGIINDKSYEPGPLRTVPYKCMDKALISFLTKDLWNMKWKATQDEAGEETSEEESISTTQTDFLAFSSLLLGYFETYPSKHSCIHSYFIPPPSPSALTLFFDQSREVGSQQEGSLPAREEEEEEGRPIHCYTVHATV